MKTNKQQSNHDEYMRACGSTKHEYRGVVFYSPIHNLWSFRDAPPIKHRAWSDFINLALDPLGKEGCEAAIDRCLDN